MARLKIGPTFLAVSITLFIFTLMFCIVYLKAEQQNYKTRHHIELFK